jgi:hypothetical protein
VVRGCVVVGIDGVVGVVDPPPLAAAAMPTPLTAATVAEARTTAYLRMDIGATPFVHRGSSCEHPCRSSRTAAPKAQLSGA